MTNTFFKLESFKNTPDIYYNQKNPLADLNIMMMYVWSKSLSLSYKFEDEILFVIGVFQGIPYLWGPPVGEKITITHIFNGVDMIQNLRDQLGIKTDEPEILYLWNEYELFNIIKSNENFNIYELEITEGKIASQGIEKILSKKNGIRKTKKSGNYFSFLKNEQLCVNKRTATEINELLRLLPEEFPYLKIGGEFIYPIELSNKETEKAVDTGVERIYLTKWIEEPYAHNIAYKSLVSR